MNRPFLTALVTTGFALFSASCNRTHDAARTLERSEVSGVTKSNDDVSDRGLETNETTRDGVAPATSVRIARIELDAEQPNSRSENNWQTEAFSETAEAQLKHVAKLLSADVPLHDEDVAEIVDRDFVCGPLRPPRLDVVFSDPSLIVSRPPSSGDVPTETSLFRGIAGFAQALSQLSEPLADAKQVRCTLKIFGVTPSAGQTATRVQFHQSGQTPRGVIQQSAIWDCLWVGSTSATAPKLKSVSFVEYERTVGRGNPAALFSDCTEAVLGNNDSYRDQLAYGLDHWLGCMEYVNGIVASSYHGLAVGDVNGDGLDDLYVCQPGGLAGGLPNRLYLQQPDGTARDASATSGLDWLIETPSALFVDLDNDGDQDLVAATMAGMIVAANDGRGVFRRQAVKLFPEAPPISLAAADFDNDGDVDIYACCYASRATTERTGRPVPYHDANNGGRNALWRNDRQWRFTNVTKQVGLDVNNRRFSFACSWEDFDNDGDQDLYVANDFGRNNLYRNDEGRFADVAAEADVEDISAGMSVSWGDYDNDGWMDLYVSNMWSSAGNRIAYQPRFLEARADRGTLAGFRRHARGNSLFSNLRGRGETSFRDVSVEAGVTMGRWAWSSRFVDINNDGWEDLIVANGNITQEDTSDL